MFFFCRCRHPYWNHWCTEWDLLTTEQTTFLPTILVYSFILWFDIDLVTREREIFKSETELKMQNKMVHVSLPRLILCSQRLSRFFHLMIQTTVCVWNTILCSANTITQCVLLPWIQKATSKNLDLFRFYFYFCEPFNSSDLLLLFSTRVILVPKPRHTLVPNGCPWKYARSATGSHQANLGLPKSGYVGTNPLLLHSQK